MAASTTPRTGGRPPLHPQISRPPSQAKPLLVLAPLVAVLAVVPFLPCLANDFLFWDDDVNFFRNPHFQGFGWTQVRWAWTTFLLGVYQPLAWMLLELEYAGWGLQSRGYHLVSLGLHAVVTVTLFWLALELIRRADPGRPGEGPWPPALGAAMAALLFAVHPLRVEPVAWASCQPYLPCIELALLSVLAYLRSVDRPEQRRRWIALSVLAYAAALLFKAVAIPLPVVLILLDIYPLRRFGGGPGRWVGPEARRVCGEKVPYVLLAVPFLFLAMLAKESRHMLAHVGGYGAGPRIAQAAYGTCFYLIKTVAPFDLTAYYPLPTQVDPADRPFAAAIIAVVVVTICLFLLRRRWPGLLVAWLTYLVVLAPNSGLVRIGGQIAADRYSYAAMLGFAVALAYAFRLACRSRAGRTAVVGGSLALAVLLGCLTWNQCGTWRSTDLLIRHAMEHGGAQDALLNHVAAAALSRQRRFAEALPFYEKSLALRPDYDEALAGLGTALARMGRLDPAERYLRAALELTPDYVEAHNNLGALLLQRGRVDEAEAEFRAALELDPETPAARLGLERCRRRRGEMTEGR